MKKCTIEDMQKIAEARGGSCLSTEYINAHSKLAWQCEYGHQWQAEPRHIIQGGTWCPACAGVEKPTIEQMQALAAARGGMCLSEKYINTATHLIWQCRRGHQWQATPRNITSGRWCPVCAGSQKGTIQQMRTLATERGGKCLSKAYINARSKLTWQCKHRHQWEATPASIKHERTWCPLCARKS